LGGHNLFALQVSPYLAYPMTTTSFFDFYCFRRNAHCFPFCWGYGLLGNRNLYAVSFLPYET
ncbi:hypothetical protein T4C_11970, partial [Trichinella pseudospiralis]